MLLKLAYSSASPFSQWWFECMDKDCIISETRNIGPLGILIGGCIAKLVVNSAHVGFHHKIPNCYIDIA